MKPFQLILILCVGAASANLSDGSFSTKTSIIRETADFTSGCGLWVSTIDQNIEWGPDVSGTQTKAQVPHSCFQTQYGLTSMTESSTYNSNGTSSITTSSTGPNGSGPSTSSPAPWLDTILYRKWSLSGANGSYTNQTTTIEIRPIPDPGESTSTYAIFIINVAALDQNGNPIPPSSITVAGSTCDANGYAYQSYPLDNALSNITPSIPSVSNYSYNLSVEMVHLDVGVEVADSPYYGSLFQFG